MENKAISTDRETNNQAEEFLSILNSCTPAQKQYFAGVLDGMKYSAATDDQAS